MRCAAYVANLAGGIGLKSGLTRDVVFVGLVWDHGIARRSAKLEIGTQGTNILALGGGFSGILFANGIWIMPQRIVFSSSSGHLEAISRIVCILPHLFMHLSIHISDRVGATTKNTIEVWGSGTQPTVATHISLTVPRGRAQGSGAFHALGIAQDDLSLKNMLVFREEVRVADFGSAFAAVDFLRPPEAAPLTTAYARSPEAWL